MGIDKSDIRHSTSRKCCSAVTGSCVVAHIRCVQVGDTLLYVWQHRGLCTGTLQSLTCLPVVVILGRCTVSNVRSMQESGRAGRDGGPSLSILYVSPADIEWCQRICKPQERPKLGAMVDYACEVRCRRAQLLAYFDEKNGRCRVGVDALCDVCTSSAAVRKLQQDGTARRSFLVRLYLLNSSQHCIQRADSRLWI